MGYPHRGLRIKTELCPDVHVQLDGNVYSEVGSFNSTLVQYCQKTNTHTRRFYSLFNINEKSERLGKKSMQK